MPQHESRPGTHGVGAGPTDSNRSTTRPIGTDSTAQPVPTVLLDYDTANRLRYQLAAIDLPPGVSRTDFQAMLTGAVRDALHRGLDALDDQRAATKQAAVDVAAAADWRRVASEIQRRDQFYRQHPHLKRRRSA